MATVAWTAEGGTNGTGITTGNSGGASGNAFDTVTLGAGATAVYDVTNARQSFAAKLATGGSAADCSLEYSTKIGAQTQAWFRAYCYIPSNPGTNHRLIDAYDSGSGQLCFAIYLTTTGKLQSVDTAGAQIQIMTGSVPLNAWFRVEAMVIGSATVGQVEVKRFDTPDSPNADETITSTANKNTRGSFNNYRFGAAGDPLPANRTIWLDNLGISTVGYMGPAAVADPLMVFTPPGRIAPNGLWSPFPTITDVAAAADVTIADTPSGVRAAESPATVAFDLLVADSPSPVRLAESPATAGPSTAIADTPAGVRAAESPATTTITVLIADTPSAVRAGPSPATVTFDVRTADTPSGVRAGESPAAAGSSTFVADTPAGARLGASPATVVFDVVTTDAPNGVRAAASPATTTITVLVADAPNAVRLSGSFAGAGSSTFAADVASGIRAGSAPASVTFGIVLPDTPAAYRLPATTRVGTTTGPVRSYDTAEAVQLAHQSASTPVGTSSGTAKIG